MTDDRSDADGAAASDPPTSGDAVVVELQDSLRPELKAPMGPIYTAADALLADADRPVVAVGDIVTYTLLEAGATPAVAFVDGRTKRTAVDDHIQDAIDGDAFDNEVAVENPPGTLSEPLLAALSDAFAAAERGETTVVVVDGEEDLAALPAIASAPRGATVIYGQPDEGMVRVACEGEAVETVRDLLQRMNGDTERLFALLDS